jgi:hypothetical protein
MTEEGRSRRSDTVWLQGPQDRPPPEKLATEGFWVNNLRTHHLLRSGDSINVFGQPLP